MAAGALLKRFLRKGVVLEGRGRRLAAATATILAVGSTVVLPAASARVLRSPAQDQLIQSIYAQNLPDLPSMGILHDASYPKMRNFTRADDPGQPAGSARAGTIKGAGSSLALIDYSAMVQDIQAQVDREFPNRIHIVDRSKPIAGELTTIAALTGKPLPDNETFILRGDPHTSPAFGPKATICVVVGPTPEQGAHEIAVGFAEEQLGGQVGFKPGVGITDETWHRFSIWHEVGHCLLGSSEAKADSFGLLKTVADSGRVNFLDDLIVVRELMERISTPLDEHIISPTLRHLTDRYRAGASIDAGRTLKEIGGIVDKLPTPVDAWTILFRNRLAMTRFDAKTRDFDIAHTGFLVPVNEGFVLTDFRGWLKASISIPEVARVEHLISYLSADPATRIVPLQTSTDRGASETAVVALARAGDPVARSLAPLYGTQPASFEVPLVNAGLVSANQVEGRLIAFDRSSAVVRFAKDLQSFLVRDAVSNRPILAGNTQNGVTKVFQASHPTQTANRDVPAPSS